MSRERSRAALKNHEITLKPITRKHLPGKLTVLNFLLALPHPLPPPFRHQPIFPVTQKAFQLKKKKKKGLLQHNVREDSAVQSGAITKKEHTLSGKVEEKGD